MKVDFYTPNLKEACDITKRFGKEFYTCLGHPTMYAINEIEYKSLKPLLKGLAGKVANSETGKII